MWNQPAIFPLEITRLTGSVAQVTRDAVAVEAPLEVRVGGRSVAVIMRTPGCDRELAAGFLWTEGVLRVRDDLLDLVHCGPAGEEPNPDLLDAVLAPGVDVDWQRLTRHVFTSSSCGLCGKATLEAVRAAYPPVRPEPGPRPEVLRALPEQLRAAQAAFAATGGLHASALFTLAGERLAVCEDVGRHNALDKIIGGAFLADRLPLSGTLLLVSGRVSFEIMQKALTAGIPWVAAVSAPTSLAVEFARENGQGLVGFLRGERMNIYAGTLAEA